MKRASTDIEAIVKELGLYEEYRLERIRKKLNTLLPAPLNRHIYPLILKEGQLLFVVDSRAKLLLARSLEQLLLQRLKDHGVQSVRFKLGRVPYSAPKTSSTAYRPAQPPQELLQEVEDQIKDPELKQAILKAIRGTLSDS